MGSPHGSGSRSGAACRSPSRPRSSRVGGASRPPGCSSPRSRRPQPEAPDGAEPPPRPPGWDAISWGLVRHRVGTGTLSRGDWYGIAWELGRYLVGTQSGRGRLRVLRTLRTLRALGGAYRPPGALEYRAV